jgi:FkbM family methyltransferase
MKRLILAIIRRLSGLARLNDTVFLLLKDEALLNPAEHFIRIKKLIRRKKPVHTGMVVIDIGAASGDSCLYFAAHFPECRVVGFEPIRESFEIAKKRTFNNSAIEIRNMALFANQGEMDFYVTDNKLSSSLNSPNLSRAPYSGSKLFENCETRRVGVSTLDDELKGDEEILLIKIDTQGSELSVLQGAKAALKRTCFILSEMNNHDDYNEASKYFELDAFLRSNNFILADLVVTYRHENMVIEYDAIYMNRSLS